MTLDSWNDLFNAAGVLLIGVTFVVGLGALLTGREINKRQSAEILRLSTELAKQQERAAKAERELLVIREKLAPRQISPEQRAMMADVLRSNSSAKGPVSLRSVIGDGEALAYRTQIESVVRAADWPVVEVEEAQLAGPGEPIGVAIAVRDPSAPPKSAAALFEAFGRIGIHPLGVMDHRLGHDVVRVLIHHKP